MTNKVRVYIGVTPVKDAKILLYKTVASNGPSDTCCIHRHANGQLDCQPNIYSFHYKEVQSNTPWNNTNASYDNNIGTETSR